jgi:hypothetical protein
MFSRSEDGGRTWSASVGVSDATSGQRRNPALAVIGAHIGIAWLDARAEGQPLHGRPRAEEDVYFAASADRGATWSANNCLEKDLAAKDSRPSEPALAATPQGAVACAYFSMRKYKASVGGFWIARSADGGSTFDIDRHGEGALGSLSLAAAEGRLYLGAESTTHVAIRVPPEPQSQVLLFASRDDGQTWGRPVRIDEDAGASWRTNVRLEPAGSGRLLAAWDDHTTGIVLAASIDGGETWGKTVKVAERSAVGLTAIDVAVDPASGAFYLVVGHVSKGAGGAIQLVKGKVASGA